MNVRCSRFIVYVFCILLVLSRVQLLLKILCVNLHADFPAINFEPIQKVDSVFCFLRFWKFNDRVPFWVDSNMIALNFDLFDLTISLKVLKDVWLIDVVHLFLINKSLNTYFTILLFPRHVQSIFLNQGWSDSALFLLHFFLELCGLSRSILLCLWSLDHQGLSVQLLSGTSKCH